MEKITKGNNTKIYCHSTTAGQDCITTERQQALKQNYIKFKRLSNNSIYKDCCDIMCSLGVARSFSTWDFTVKVEAICQLPCALSLNSTNVYILYLWDVNIFFWRYIWSINPNMFLKKNSKQLKDLNCFFKDN